MMIGMYSYYINIMSNPLTYTLNNPIQMIFIILGIIVGAVIFIKLMNYLLNKYYSTTYSLIIGFVLGSLIVMYPNTINITGILTLFIGILVSYYFSTYLRK
jgi:putative membrane protein